MGLILTISGWIAFIISTMMLVMLFLMSKEVILPVMKSKSGKKLLLFVQRADETYDMVVGKKKGKYVDTKEYGKFKITENAFKRFGTTTIAQAYETVPYLVPSEFIQACKTLKERGFDDLKSIDVNKLQKEWDNVSEVPITEVEKKLNDAKVSADTKQKLEEHLTEYRRLGSIYDSISEVQNFLKTSGSPIEMDSIIDQEAEMKAKQKSKDNLARLLTIGLAAGVVIAALAAFVYIYGSMAQCPSAAQFADMASKCAGTAAREVPI